MWWSPSLRAHMRAEGLTIGALYGPLVELLVPVIAADVSLLLQLLGGVIDVLLRNLVRNHLWVGGGKIKLINGTVSGVTHQDRAALSCRSLGHNGQWRGGLAG